MTRRRGGLADDTQAGEHSKRSEGMVVSPARQAIVESAIQHIAQLAQRGFHASSVKSVATSSTSPRLCSTITSVQSKILESIILSAARNSIAAPRTAVLRSAVRGSTAQLGALVRAGVLLHTTKQAELWIRATQVKYLNTNGRRLANALWSE